MTEHSSTPARPGYTRRATSDFTNQLKHLQNPTSPSPPPPETALLPNGQTATIKTSSTHFSIPSTASISLPTSPTLNLIATLFYVPHKPVHPPTLDASEIAAPLPVRQDALYGETVSDMAIYTFVTLLQGLTVPFIPTPAHHRRLAKNVVEITLSRPSGLTLDELRHHIEIFNFERDWNITVMLQNNDIFRRHKRLVVFDLDSTLIQHETIDELAKFVGVEKEVSRITARAMNGELDFEASLRARCGLLRGVPEGVWGELEREVKFMPGARELTRGLKRLGVKMAVCSGGFQPLCEWVKRELGLDYAEANNLVVDREKEQLTGELEGRIVHAERKREVLEMLAGEMGVPLSQTIAVGDGANDLKMLGVAGLGVAFNAKPTVQAVAPTRINTPSLQDILFALGLSEEEQEQLLRD